MEIKIGIKDVAREVTIDTVSTGEEVENALTAALADNGVLTLVDEKGRKVIVPAAQIGYVDLGQEHTRPVGFGVLG